MRTSSIQSLLWIDCSGGLLVGAGLWLLSRWLRPLFGLPEDLYHGVTAANLAYGCFAFFVATRRPRSVRLISVLAGANALWGVFCLVAITQVFQRDALIGCAHLLVEAVFVFWLARMEWRHRWCWRKGDDRRARRARSCHGPRPQRENQ